MKSDSYVMGIDGGGSGVRVAILTPALELITESHGSSANPNSVGHETAAYHIQTAIQTALKNASLTHDQIACVGIGVGGAAPEREGMWLHSTINALLPTSSIALSSDYEIALTGAHGAHQGILVLAGTGSLAYGVSSQGKSALAGGWGWLLGDEGGGYWIGLEALRAVIRATEKRSRATTLLDAVFNQLQLHERQKIIQWAYAESRTREIAALAPLVLEHAQQGDAIATRIVERAAQKLAIHVRSVRYQLDMEVLPIAFAGSLLTHANPLSLLLCELLKIDTLPQAKYPPVIGAALLALSQQP